MIKMACMSSGKKEKLTNKIFSWKILKSDERRDLKLKIYFERPDKYIAKTLILSLAINFFGALKSRINMIFKIFLFSEI